MKSLFVLALLGLMGCSDDKGTTTPTTSEDVGTDVTTADAGGDTGNVASTTFSFDLNMANFFDVPFPSDVRKKADGTYGYTDYASLEGVQVGKLWLDAADDLKTGFGLTSAVFMTFSSPLDEATLPQTYEASLTPESSVFLEVVDAASPKNGERLPIKCKFTEAAGKHHPPNLLACASPFGDLREPNTQYALVVTTDVLDRAGNPVAAPSSFTALLDGTDQEGAHGTVAAQTYVDAKNALVAAGTDATKIAGFTLFTTFDPTSRLVRIYDFYKNLPQPELDTTKPIEQIAVYDDYVVLKAFYNVPNIQKGPLPYALPPSGVIEFDDNGDPIVGYQESVQVNITIPRGPMPAAGFPLLIYAHGSGGEAKELMNRGPKTAPNDVAAPGTGPAATLALYGVAGFSADFALHDTRYPQSPDTTGLKLYNLLGNPRAMIDNFVVAANEVGLHSRLMAATTIDPAVSAELDPTWYPDGVIKFNKDAFAVMGQSMGSMISTPAVTLPNEIDALINSGSGGTLLEIALASKDPVEVKPLLRRLLQLGNDEEFDEFDPALNALQNVFDWIDPTLAARHVILRPHLNAKPRHVFHPSGLEDRYFSPRARAGLSLALGVPMADPVLEPIAFDWMKWAGYESGTTLPITANLPDGVTGFVRQFEPAYPEAGHYVMFDKPEARAQYGCFMKSLAQGAPVLRTPEESTPENCP
ncbi:MAG: hypothetical protein R3E66_21465 [bacterium]